MGGQLGILLNAAVKFYFLLSSYYNLISVHHGVLEPKRNLVFRRKLIECWIGKIKVGCKTSRLALICDILFLALVFLLELTDAKSSQRS